MTNDLSPYSPAPMTASPQRRPLAGRIRFPGDKSISHRALMLYKLLICAPGVVCVLMNIEHGFGTLHQCGRDQAKKRPSRA